MAAKFPAGRMGVALRSMRESCRPADAPGALRYFGTYLILCPAQVYPKSCFRNVLFSAPHRCTQRRQKTSERCALARRVWAAAASRSTTRAAPFIE